MRDLADDLTERRKLISRIHPATLDYIVGLTDAELERACRDLYYALVSQAPGQASSLWNLYAAASEETGFRDYDAGLRSERGLDHKRLGDRHASDDQGEAGRPPPDHPAGP